MKPFPSFRRRLLQIPGFTRAAGVVLILVVVVSVLGLLVPSPASAPTPLSATAPSTADLYPHDLVSSTPLAPPVVAATATPQAPASPTVTPASTPAPQPTPPVSAVSATSSNQEPSVSVLPGSGTPVYATIYRSYTAGESVGISQQANFGQSPGKQADGSLYSGNGNLVLSGSHQGKLFKLATSVYSIKYYWKEPGIWALHVYTAGYLSDLTVGKGTYSEQNKRLVLASIEYSLSRSRPGESELTIIKVAPFTQEAGFSTAGWDSSPSIPNLFAAADGGPLRLKEASKGLFTIWTRG